VNDLDFDNKIRITKYIMSILDAWGLSAREQHNILSLPKGTPTRALRKYRDNTPFPFDENISERVEHLLGIADALRTTFPRNIHMGPQWMNEPNRKLGEKTPVAIIINDGLSGIKNVRSLLDCAYAWRQSEA
jgi:hypothetical protein